MTATECINHEYVILVDEKDNQIGMAEKLEAHEKNLLHRAFSAFIFRRQPHLEVLLQQRALHKYHSPGLWTNTCCSHPRLGESVIDAGERRLQEELGITTALQHVSWFIYNAHFSNGLSEHELDHVLVAEVMSDIIITSNPAEVHAYRWVTLKKLEEDIMKNPEIYTPWLNQALQIAKSSFHHTELYEANAGIYHK